MAPPPPNGADTAAAPANVLFTYPYPSSFRRDNCKEAVWSGGRDMAMAFNDAKIFAFWNLIKEHLEVDICNLQVGALVL